MKQLFTSLVLILLTARVATGQDDHYWSQQYGAVSSTLGGAVVGGVRDNSAIYYNPGAQAFLDNPNLSVDANLYRLDRILIRNGGGNEVNLNSSQLSIYPQIVSGLINLVKVPRMRFGYAILTRNFGNILMNTRFTDGDLDYNPDPSTKFIGALDYNNQLNEQWFGISAAYRISAHHGIGLSLYGSYRGQTYSVTDFIREVRYLDSAAWFSTFNVDENIKYSTAMILAKIGWAYETGRWRLGLSLTTPALRLFGSGSIQREISIYAASDQPGDTSVSFLILDRQSSVKAYYRYPFSVAGGVEYHAPKTRLAVTLEYFTGVHSYYLMNTVSTPLVYPPWISDSADAQEYLKGYLNVKNSARPVLNAAIGLSQDLLPKFSLLLGARTDFSSYDKSGDATILMHNSGEWNLYNLSAGLSYHTTRQTITLGFHYTFSQKRSVDPYAVINPFSPSGTQAKVFSQSFGLVLGYTHYLRN
jgi:hypothetical protein